MRTTYMTLPQRLTTAGALLPILSLLLLAVPAGAQTAKPSRYRGWDTLEMTNRYVRVDVAPRIGGRVIQFRLGDFEYFFVNDQLAGKGPTSTGLGPGGKWLNYGGEKLWPAPQGWSGADEWPGPPDAVLDGSPHEARILSAAGDCAVVELRSRKDPRSGIRFSRKIKVFPRSTRVHIEATMENIDTRLHRWGIWSVAQQDARNRAGSGPEKKLRVYCPMRPGSVFADGYKVMFGLANNTSFQPDREHHLMRVHYQRRVGKIGIDCAAGWVATVQGSTGHVFVQRFPFFDGKPYPDNASVEIWLHGTGQFIVDGKIDEMEDDPVECPYFIETEVLSPYAELKPGETASFAYDWYAAFLGGDYPIVDCTDAGVVAAPLEASSTGGALGLSGRFGVFHEGTAGIVFLDGGGKEVARTDFRRSVSPTRALVLARQAVSLPPAGARYAALVIRGPAGGRLGELARAPLRPGPK